MESAIQPEANDKITREKTTEDLNNDKPQTKITRAESSAKIAAVLPAVREVYSIKRDEVMELLDEKNQKITTI